MAKLSEVIARIEEIEAGGGDASELRGKVDAAGYGDRLPQLAPPPPAPPQDQGFDFGNMVSNIPGSAMNMASSMWQGITNPIDTAKAMGQAGIGGLQHLQEAAPAPLKYMAPFALAGIANAAGQDYRPVASAVGQNYKDRYGGVDEALDTLEEDPVGAVADVAGLFGTAAPRLAAKVNPITRAASAAGKKMGESIMGSSAKFSKLNTPDENARMVNTMLEKGVNPSLRGTKKLEKLINQQAKVVDDLIAQADEAGTIPIGQVLRRLQELKKERGSSLVSGGEDIAAINNFTEEIMGNVRRLGKRDLSASDLQGFKRDLYDRIAWNARRQIDEVPVMEDARKSTARYTKEQIEALAPETKTANRQLGDLLELRPNLERAARRIEDRDVFGMTDMFAVGTGLGAGAAVSPTLGLGVAGAIELFSNPKIAPTTARAIYNAGKGVGTAAAQPAFSLPYLGGELYYAGEKAALFEDEE